MKAEIRSATINSDGEQGPAILIIAEDVAESFALLEIIKNGIRVHNHGGSSSNGNVTTLIGYSKSPAIIKKKGKSK